MAENGLENARSFVHDGFYYLALNNHCYVLDGSQKTSWENEKTNLQYECYYLDNIPAQCFAKMGSRLFFSDHKGNLCFFKRADDVTPYTDRYSVGEANWVATVLPEDDEVLVSSLGGSSGDSAYLINSDGAYLSVAPNGALPYDSGSTYVIGDYALYHGGLYLCIADISTPEEWTEKHWAQQETDRLLVYVGDPAKNATVSYMGNYYTITDIFTDIDSGEKKAKLSEGVPIYAELSTIADDDGMVHFFKT